MKVVVSRGSSKKDPKSTDRKFINIKIISKMNFLDLIKLIHQTTKKSTKWPDEDISKVFVKCHHLHELNELLLFCKYQEYEADGMSKLYYNIVCIFTLSIKVVNYK